MTLEPAGRPIVRGQAPMQGRNIPNVYWQKSLDGVHDKDEAGYIVVGPHHIETEQGQLWLNKYHRTPLEEYSFTDRYSPKTGRRETIEWTEDKLVQNGDSSYMFYWFIKNGGAPLFPIRQILELKWHLFPPMGLSTDAFPQLKEYKIPDPFWCPLCSNLNPLLTEAGFIKHLMVKHEQDRVSALAWRKDARKKPERLPDELELEKVAS